MYEKDKTLLLAATASAVTNNLSAKLLEDSRIADSVAVIHGGYVNVAPVGSYEHKSQFIPCTNSPNSFSAYVTQVMWCYLGYEVCLVVASSAGLLVYDGKGLECKFTHPCKDGEQNREHFARGLANPPGDYLCVGNNFGVLRLFVMCEDGNMIFVDRKHIHGAPVCDITSSREVMASCDEEGSIALSTISPNEIVQWAKLQNFGSSCTSLKLWKNLLIGGFGSGHIRVFCLTPYKREVSLVVEICAHAQWVTGIDVALEHGYILSVSEDSFVKIWQIILGSTVTIVHKFSSQVKDCMLVGGKFLTPSGSLFAVSIYDSNLVQCFRM